MDEMKLEPCPFCGADPGVTHPRVPQLYGCSNNQCPASHMKCEADRWNRRQPQSAEWVPWKEGDPKPAGNERCIVTHTAHGAPAVGLAKPSEFGKHACPVIAYIPQRLPDPYTDAQGKRDE